MRVTRPEQATTLSRPIPPVPVPAELAERVRQLEAESARIERDLAAHELPFQSFEYAGIIWPDHERQSTAEAMWVSGEISVGELITACEHESEARARVLAERRANAQGRQQAEDDWMRSRCTAPLPSSLMTVETWKMPDEVSSDDLRKLVAALDSQLAALKDAGTALGEVRKRGEAVKDYPGMSDCSRAASKCLKDHARSVFTNRRLRAEAAQALLVRSPSAAVATQASASDAVQAAEQLIESATRLLGANPGNAQLTAYLAGKALDDAGELLRTRQAQSHPRLLVELLELAAVGQDRQNAMLRIIDSCRDFMLDAPRDLADPVVRDAVSRCMRLVSRLEPRLGGLHHYVRTEPETAQMERDMMTALYSRTAATKEDTAEDTAVLKTLIDFCYTLPDGIPQAGRMDLVAHLVAVSNNDDAKVHLVQACLKRQKDRAYSKLCDVAEPTRFSAGALAQLAAGAAPDKTANLRQFNLLHQALMWTREIADPEKRYPLIEELVSRVTDFGMMPTPGIALALLEPLVQFDLTKEDKRRLLKSLVGNEFSSKCDIGSWPERASDEQRLRLAAVTIKLNPDPKEEFRTYRYMYSYKEDLVERDLPWAGDKNWWLPKARRAVLAGQLAAK